MRQKFFVAALLVMMLVVGCGPSDPHERAIQDILSLREKVIEILATVTDKASAKAAKPELVATTKRGRVLLEKWNEVGHDKREALEEKYTSRSVEIFKKIDGEITRIRRKPECFAVLRRELAVFTPTVVKPSSPKDYDNTAVTIREFPGVAGTIRVQAPVVYCIDTSRPMANVLESAFRIVIVSAKSLKGGKFNVILLGEDADKVLSPQPIAADSAGIAKAKAFLSVELCGTAGQARGLKAALDMNAKTVVLLARDSALGVRDVVQRAFKGRSAKLHTIVLGSSSKGLAQLAELTGGKSRVLTASDLEEQAKRANRR